MFPGFASDLKSIFFGCGDSNRFFLFFFFFFLMKNGYTRNKTHLAGIAKFKMPARKRVN